MTVGCFGKLPIFADFIRHNAGSAEVRHLDQWLQEGIFWSQRKLNRNWDQAFTEMPPVCFFRPSADRATGLLGILLPSLDKGGRRYPFSIFAYLELASVASNGLLLPVLYSHFLTEALGLASSGWQGLEVPQLLERVESLRSVASQDLQASHSRYAKLREDFAAGEFWSRIRPGEGSHDHFSLLQGLAEVIIPLRKMDPSQLGYGMGLPLPQDLGFHGAETSLLLELVFSLLRRPRVWPHFFWTAGSDAEFRRLFLFFNAPSSKNFNVFLNPDADEDCLYDLWNVQDPRANTLKNNMPDSLRGILDKQDLSMAELFKELEAYNS